MKNTTLLRILDAYSNRVSSLNLKKDTQEFRDDQAAFFAGVMIALEDTDPRIYFTVMRGDDAATALRESILRQIESEKENSTKECQVKKEKS